MAVKRVEDPVFIGLLPDIKDGAFQCRPTWGDPGAFLWDFAYGSPSMPKLRHWRSWSPPSSKRGIVLCVLSRCFSYSIGSHVLTDALTDGFLMLVHQAGFPFEFVLQMMRKWSTTHRLHERRACVKTVLNRLVLDARR